MLVTEKERSEALTRMRRRLAFLLHHRPGYKATIKDTRIAIDALEQIQFLDLKGVLNREK
jgi:hypothetical protein